VYEGPLREAVRRLKYKKELSLGDTFSKEMFTLFSQTNWQVDAITPVPIGIARKSQRGYNQASLLARPLALRAGIEYLPKALVKVKDTPSQVGLNVHQRRANVRGSFQAWPGIVAGKKMMIIDDVCTSGATVEECSNVLLEAGAVEVYVITLARALFDPRDRSS
jgi:ComF family protein